MTLFPLIRGLNSHIDLIKLITTTLISSSLVSLCYASPQAQESYAFYVKLEQGNVWGIADAKGQLLGPLNYLHIHSAMPSAQQPARYIAKNPDQSFSYLDEYGNPLTTARFETAKAFSPEGIARFQQDGKWGFINTQGQVLIPATYQSVTPFYYGLAGVQTKQGFSFININGEIVISGPFKNVGHFSKTGLAAAMPIGATQFGYINRQGEWIIPAKFDQAKVFSNSGFAAVKIKEKDPLALRLLSFISSSHASEGDRGIWGVINTQGKWLVDPSYEELSHFSGQVAVAEKNYDKVLINQHGKAIHKSYDRNLFIYPDCDIATVGLYPSFYNLAGDKQAALNRLNVDWLAGFGDQCQSLARMERQWGLLSTSGKFQPFPNSIHEPLRSDYIWLDHDQHRLIATLNQNHQVEYLTPDGTPLFMLSQDEQGYLEGVSIDGTILWHSDLQGPATFPFELAPSNKEIGFNAAWLNHPSALVKTLTDSPERHFDPNIWYRDNLFWEEMSDERKQDKDTKGYYLGQAKLLAYEHIDETEIANFPYLESDERIAALEQQTKKALTSVLGTPLTPTEAKKLWFDWYSSSTLWPTSKGYIILQHGKDWGDSEVFDSLILMAMTQEQLEASSTF